jgi:RNA polymerase sporulation-specific sigma factor
MPRAQLAPVRTPERIQREADDVRLVIKARNGDQAALDALIRRYTGFVRLKASSYFLAGGTSDDLIQEGLIGLYKAVRDFRSDRETSFRSFAELCITRQIITAIKAATRFKHQPLNAYVSFSQTPAGQEEGDCTLGDALPGPGVDDPAICVISTEELQSLVFTLGTGLSGLEAAEYILGVAPEQPIVLFTAFRDTTVEIAAAKLRIRACISKSEFHRLLSRLHAYLNDNGSARASTGH